MLAVKRECLLLSAVVAAITVLTGTMLFVVYFSELVILLCFLIMILCLMLLRVLNPLEREGGL